MEGMRFGGYRITHKLAEGGMGEVYAATHELIQQDAVVKLLLPQMSANKVVAERFFNEALAAASIHHPGIVQVFDVGFTCTGRACIVMERLRGETLQARLSDRDRLSVAESVILIKQLAGAIAAAHARGIVHRDLTPGNIFIVSDPEVAHGERIKVLDFGLAKLDEPRSGCVTQTGTVFGTPAYMSPEQCSDASTVDHRADLYAIGCILYSCLCGAPPFGRGGLELIASQLRDMPRPPRSHNPAVPPQLDAIVMKLLQKQPDDRVQSCQALVDALHGEYADWCDAPARPRPRAASSAVTLTDPYLG